MKIIVTGGAGFIGSNIVDRLLEDGHQVEVIDNFYSGREENLVTAEQKHPSNLTVHEMDIRDNQINELFQISRPDCVMHLAAQIDVRKSVSDPVFDADVNITGSLNILEASVAAGVKRFIFTSSGGAVYAEPQYLPVDEKHAKQPLSPYGISKKAIVDYLTFYHDHHKLAAISLAPGNVYGPRQDPFGEAGVVAIFTGKMLASETPTINGDGEQVRDYIYVDDVADAYLTAMSSDVTGFFNIGTGAGSSVNDLFKELAAITGFTKQPAYGPAKPGEMRRIYLNCELAARELGWKAKTGFRQGLQETVEYFRAT